MGLDKKIQIITVIFGLVTIGLAAVMVKVFPSTAELPDGFSTPIIAFEFAKSEADVAYLIGDSEDAKKIREGMRAGHKLDAYFPIAYAGFLTLLLIQFLRNKESLAMYAIPIAILIIPFDWNENARLLDIVTAAESGVLKQVLFDELNMATWLKWGSIALSVFILSLLFFKNKNIITGLFGLVYVGATAAAIGTGQTGKMLEVMAMCLSPFLLAAFVVELQKFRRIENETG